jgi:hypothetical protein
LGSSKSRRPRARPGLDFPDDVPRALSEGMINENKNNIKAKGILVFQNAL